MKLDGRHLSWCELRVPLLVIATWIAFGVFGGLAASTTVSWLSSLFLVLGFLALFSPLLYLSFRNILPRRQRNKGEWALPAFASGAIAIAVYRLLVADIVMAVTFMLISGFLLVIWLLRQQQL